MSSWDNFEMEWAMELSEYMFLIVCFFLSGLIVISIIVVGITLLRASEQHSTYHFYHAAAHTHTHTFSHCIFSHRCEILCVLWNCHRLRECIIVETVKSLTGRDTIYIYGIRFAMLLHTLDVDAKHTLIHSNERYSHSLNALTSEWMKIKQTVTWHNNCNKDKFLREIEWRQRKKNNWIKRRRSRRSREKVFFFAFLTCSRILQIPRIVCWFFVQPRGIS